MEVEIRVRGLDDVLLRFARLSRHTRREVDAVTARYGRLTVEEIRNEIQRQGLIETGEYLDSWSYRSIRGGFEVYTDHPAANRLEEGFTGMDALGRMYHDQPRPHVRPVRERIEPQYVEAVAKVVPLLWRR